MEYKIGSLFVVDFPTPGSDGVPIAPDSSPVVQLFENASNNPFGYTPTVLVKAGLPGNYAAYGMVTAAFTAGNIYSAWAFATIAGKNFAAPVGTFIVRKYSTDDMVLAVNAWVASGGVLNPGGTVFVGDPITIIRGDDYTAATRKISFLLVNGPELSSPAVPVFMGVGEERGDVPNYWTSAAGTATRVDATTQRLDFSVPRTTTILAPAPKTLGYSIEARFAPNPDQWTVWTGECNYAKKYTG